MSRPARCVALSLVLLQYASVSFAQLAMVRVHTGLSWPVYATGQDGGSDRIYIVEQEGRVLVSHAGVLQPVPFLDVSDRVSDLSAPGGLERGLLKICFHPQYQSNGRFFLYYMNRADSHTVLSEFQVTADPNLADPASEQILLSIPQDGPRHNGGHVAFSPVDGYLYLTLGDGHNRFNAQPMDRLTGKVVRLDVDGGSPYAIPPDNPFVGEPSALDEIWSSGWRNPWMMDFDPADGSMWVADVGHDSWEEIDFEPAGMGGRNYGYPLMEGAHCFELPQNCDDGTLQLPVFEYAHDLEPFGCSISGGVVYRGSSLAGVDGHYFYGDFCTAQVWSLYRAGAVWQSVEWTPFLAPDLGSLERPVSFGRDANGEMLLCDWAAAGSGELFRIVAGATDVEVAPDTWTLQLDVQPLAGRGGIRFGLRSPSAEAIELRVVDVRGRLHRAWSGRADGEGWVLDWDGTNSRGIPLARGIYWAQARQGGQRVSRQLLLGL